MILPRQRSAEARPDDSGVNPPDRRDWRRLVTGYGVPLVATVAATFTWFSPGTFIAGGDVSPYMRANLASELTEYWNHQFSGAGSTSYAIVQALDVGLLWVTGALGLAPTVAQHLLFAFCFGLAAFGTAFLAAAWVRRGVAIAAAGLLGMFNAFLLVNHPNVLPALSLGLIGVLVGLVLRAAQGRRVSGLVFAVCTLPGSYLAQNPPLLVVVAGSVVAAAGATGVLAGRAALRRATFLLLRSVPWVAALNLWWLLPYGHTLLTGGAGLAFTAQTNVDAWAWTQARVTLSNVVTLNSHWGWKYPEYFPFAPGMESGMWPPLRWLLPVLALAGVVLADRPRRRAALMVACVTVLLIFLGKGGKPPLGMVNSWLFHHVPGMWLLRDPMSKIGPLIVLAYAVLAALAVDRVVALTGRGAGRLARSTMLRRSVRLLAAAAMIAAVSYPWPLWTGEVVPEVNRHLAGRRVAVPADWYQLAEKINGAEPAGKVLVLPLNRYYQVSTTWGYHGVDTVPTQLLRRPVLQPLPGGYFDSTDGVTTLLWGVQNALLAGDNAAVLAQLRALGVGYVVVRHDLADNVRLPPHADYRQIEAALGRMPTTSTPQRYSVASVYQLPAESGSPVRTYHDLVGMRQDAPSSVASVIAALPDGTAVTADPSAPVSSLSWDVSGTQNSGTFTLPETGTYQLSRPAMAAADYRAVVNGNGRPRLVLTDAVTTKIEGVPLPPRPPLEIPVDTPEVAALTVGAFTQPVTTEGTLVTVGANTDVRAHAVVEGAQPLPPMPDRVDDCNHYDTRSPAEAGLALTYPEHGTLELAATAHTACTWATMPASGDTLYRIRLSHLNVSGRPARICLWQQGPETCAPLSQPGVGQGWQSYTGFAHVQPGTKALSLYLYADGDAGGTVVRYRDISVEPLRPVGNATVSPTVPPRVERELTAGKHDVTFEQHGPTDFAGAISPLQDCNNVLGGALTNGKLGARESGGMVELSAEGDGTACVWVSPSQDTVAGIYHLSVDYRTTNGRPARICVWQQGPQRCADTPPLPLSSEWQRLSTVVRPDPGAERLQVYLYADGQPLSPTNVAYRDISLTRAPPITLVVAEPPAGQADTPTLSTTSTPGGGYQVSVREAKGQFVLALAESFGNGWEIAGLPPGWRASHFRLNGYANGWLVHGAGDATLTLAFRPSATMTAAVQVSAGAGLIAVGLAITSIRRLRRRRGGSVRSTTWEAIVDKQRLALGTIKVARRIFSHTPVHSWRVTKYLHRRVFRSIARGGDRTSTFRELNLTYPTEDTAIGPGLLGGYYEQQELTLFERLAESSRTIIDVGGNIGVYACAGGVHLPADGLLVTFEPVPDNVAYLRRNLAQNGIRARVDIEPLALGEEPGEITIHLAAGMTGTHSVSARNLEAPRGSIVVPMTTLDSYVDARALDRVDLLKVDVEGFDLAVLRGAHRMLAADGPTLFLEYAPALLRNCGFAPTDLVDLVFDSYEHVLAVDEPRGTVQPALPADLAALKDRSIVLNLVCIRRPEHLALCQSMTLVTAARTS